MAFVFKQYYPGAFPHCKTFPFSIERACSVLREHTHPLETSYIERVERAFHSAC